MRARLAASVVAALLVGALLGAPLGMVVMANGAGAATAGAATAGAAAAACRPGRHVVCIGRSDGGHRVHVQEGQTVTVQLGGPLRWSGLRQVGPPLLRRRGSTVESGGQLTASYIATKAGRTALRASGAPKCAAGQACPQFIVLWQVQVVIASR